MFDLRLSYVETCHKTGQKNNGNQGKESNMSYGFIISH